ncbi:M48 family metallopeptidase [Sinimarinibacterium thermocellulolyticum]|uniref:SprT family zinc-dependent metalloprotease n=1 Tax=Sinimarinibacterium thermocellulolyticum TaxID=3170016 RepID=A0ABV2A7A3_9GAMM
MTAAPSPKPGARAAAAPGMQLDLFRAEPLVRERISARARRLRIEVRPDGEVVLVYPRWVPRAEALAFLRAREAWVREKLAELGERVPAPPHARWDGTDEILLDGRLVPVCVEPATLRQIQVRIEPEVVTVFAPPAICRDAPRLERALRHALMRKAQRLARQLLDFEAARLGVQWRELLLRDPRTQWGSCSPDGTISLSWRLVMAPLAAFRYVVVHELCHCVHMDHSPRFWALVERQMPDFATHKRWLHEHGARLLHYLPPRRRS